MDAVTTTVADSATGSEMISQALDALLSEVAYLRLLLADEEEE